MLLYSTENDLDDNAVDCKESPLKSIVDDIDVIKLEDEQNQVPDYIVKEEVIEETID